jgi:hypothetical protein
MRGTGELLKNIEFCSSSNYNRKRRTNIVLPWPIPARQSLRNLQRRGAFIAAYPIEKWKMTIKNITPPLALIEPQ